MPVNFQVQEFAMTPSSPLRQLVREHHYLRVTGEGESLYIQHGQVVSETGPALDEDEWPEWFLPAVLLCSREALEAVEWPGPYPEPLPAARGRRR
jgi:hypothetical protein